MRVLNAHYKRQCHPETCCCPTDYVIVEGGMVIDNVDSEEKGMEIIKELEYRKADE